MEHLKILSGVISLLKIRGIPLTMQDYHKEATSFSGPKNFWKKIGLDIFQQKLTTCLKCHMALRMISQNWKNAIICKCLSSVFHLHRILQHCAKTRLSLSHNYNICCWKMVSQNYFRIKIFFNCFIVCIFTPEFKLCSSKSCEKFFVILILVYSEKYPLINTAKSVF